MNQLERPSSRTDVDSRRFGEIGRVQTAEWEGRIKGSTENLPTRTPPPKRKELNMKRNPDLERGFDTKTPEPLPPPTRMTYPPNTIKEPEKFAHDIAETVVSNMEKNSEKKTQKTQPAGGLYFAAPASTTHRELHGPVYVQEDNRRVGMTFQQEERRRDELRKQEE